MFNLRAAAIQDCLDMNVAGAPVELRLHLGEGQMAHQ